MRLTGFDYSRPMFYMVTLKCLPERQALSTIGAHRPIIGGRETLSSARNTTVPLSKNCTAKPDNATLYRRCHEMGDLAVAALGKGAKRLGEPPSQLPPLS